MKIVIPFVQMEAKNPNLSTRKKDSDLETYFRCIVIAFASIRHWNANIELQLTTNISIKEPYACQLNNLNVATKLIEYAHNPPDEFGDNFRGCFYLFDAIIAEDEDVLYLDPDVVCVGVIHQENFINNEIGALNLQFSDDQLINGISPAEARKIYSRISGSQNIENHYHFGGEAVYVSKLVKNSLVTNIESLWLANVNAARRGGDFLTTEEHILSLIFSKYNVTNLNNLILRIWTTIRYNKVEGGNLESHKICLWHLPAEKSFGFRNAYELYINHELFKNKNPLNNIDFFHKIFGIGISTIARFFRRI